MNVSVNVVLISSQLGSRGRPFAHVSVDDLQAFDTALLRNSIVIDSDALVSFQLSDGVAEADHARLLDARRKVLQSCLAMDVPYVFLSDGRVFDGFTERQHEYVESDQKNAGSVAGKQLAEYESLVRTGPLIAAQEGNFLGDCLVTMRGGSVLTLNDSVTSCPTPVSDLARVVSGIVDQLSCGASCRGVYHYNSSGSASAYEFAEVVCAFASQFVAPVADIAADDEGITWRPDAPVLSCNQILQDFGIKQLPWRAYLPRMVRAICEEVTK